MHHQRRLNAATLALGGWPRKACVYSAAVIKKRSRLADPRTCRLHSKAQSPPASYFTTPAVCIYFRTAVAELYDPRGATFPSTRGTLSVTLQLCIRNYSPTKPITSLNVGTSFRSKWKNSTSFFPQFRAHRKSSNSHVIIRTLIALLFFNWKPGLSRLRKSFEWKMREKFLSLSPGPECFPHAALSIEQVSRPDLSLVYLLTTRWKNFISRGYFTHLDKYKKFHGKYLNSLFVNNFEE